jgi:Haem-binding uptake, Tiki superfamily, ChaN
MRVGSYSQVAESTRHLRAPRTSSAAGRPVVMPSRHSGITFSAMHRATASLLMLLLAAYGACTLESLEWTGGPRTEDLRDYKLAFQRELGTRFTAAVSWREFTSQLRQARVLWLGDNHLDPNLHERQLELLRRLHAGGFRMVLGLEAIGRQDEPSVRAFLAGRSDMAELRAGMLRRWPGSWLDDHSVDCTFYRQLLELARSQGAPVFGLEPTPRAPLRERDAVIADTVCSAAAQHADRLVVIVVGQAHLLGDGALRARCALPSVAIAAEPTAALRASAPRVRPREHFLRAEPGMLFFSAGL